MATNNAMLKLLNAQKTGQFTEWERGAIYALTINHVGGSKEFLAKICERIGFSQDQVSDEDEGLPEIKIAA